MPLGTDCWAGKDILDFGFIYAFFKETYFCATFDLEFLLFIDETFLEILLLVIFFCFLFLLYVSGTTESLRESSLLKILLF